ncbi:uncharacterized protein LOC134684896 [Mytilus trossulus]|uniref:uncharacterized protein LOC134684896 n=1 Tax=Mytilus trossulus TaxID=6551 RepID=UPI0030050CCB
MDFPHYEISELKLQLDRDGSRSPKAGFHVALEELKLQLAVKTEALKAAKQTEEDFREQINSLRKQLESAHQSMKEVHTTEKQVYYMRDNSDGNGHSDQYQDFIQRELNELQRIQEAEKQILLDLKEKSMFEKSHNLVAELAAIQTLKRELEAGIQRNNKLQQQLEQQKSRSPRKGSKDSSQIDHFDMERRFSDQSSDTANTSDSRRSSDTTPRNQDIEVPQHSYSWPLVQNKKPQLLKTWSPSSTDSDIPLNHQSLSEKSAPMLRKFIRQMKNQFDKAGKENDELRRKVDGFDSREIPGRNDSDVSSLPIMHLEIERLTQELSVKNEEIRKLKSSIGFAVDSMDLNDVPNLTLTDLQNENLKLKVQLGNLEELNMLLKKQIALNSQSASPDILKSLLMEARCRLQALEGKLEATEGTVRLARGRLQALKGTLEATEGTVRLQTKKMKYYRNLLEENGLVFKSPLGIRSNSESNIVMALGGRNLCKNNRTLSYDNIPELLVDSQTESSESDFSENYKSYRNTNNVSELKDQVRQLKIAMDKYKAVIKSNMSQAKAQKLEETGGFVAKHTCLKERIRKWERKCHEIECYYNEAAARIKKSADVIVNRMLIELESGGNVRFEEGSPTDIWFSSCPDLVLSRFCASDYKDHNVSGIKIHRIIRIHNRMLQTRFDDILSSIVDDPDGEYYPCNRNTGYRKLLEYLFWMQDPQLSNGANEPGHLLEEGFLEAQTYSDLRRDGAVSLSNSLSLADRHRIEHLTKNGKNSDYSDSCSFRYGQLVISKVYLGKSVKALDDRQISKSSYPKIDAVFKPRKMCISNEGDTLCECSARQCEWYLFDSRLVLPEYVVEFEYVTKWRELEAELEDQTALYQRANALNSRKKLENDIKDLRQQAELAVFVKEDAVIQLKHVQVQMNDNQTELDEMQASMKDIERKLENYKADVLKLQEDLPASDRRNAEAKRDELYIFTLFTSLSFGGVILMLKFKTMQNL